MILKKTLVYNFKSKKVGDLCAVCQEFAIDDDSEQDLETHVTILRDEVVLAEGLFTSHNSGFGYVDLDSIQAKYKRKGLGTDLMKICVGLIDEQKYPIMKLRLDALDKEGELARIAFFKDLGFIQSQGDPNFFSTSVSRLKRFAPNELQLNESLSTL